MALTDELERMPKHLLAAAAMLASASAFGHTEDGGPNPEGLKADMSVVAAYRSAALVRVAEPWTVPGTLMGGEAMPSRAGLGLDEALLAVRFRREATYATFEVGKHAGAEDLELAHALVGLDLGGGFNAEIGKLAAAFTPFHGDHASTASFSTPRLVYQVFWGGAFEDEGLRLRWMTSGVTLGGEAWRGRSFPVNAGNSDKAAWDLFARFEREGERYSFLAAGHHFRGEAVQRTDQRYSATHTHGAGFVESDPTYFTGDVQAQGVSLAAAADVASDCSLGAQGEAGEMRYDGELSDPTRVAPFESRLRGFWGEVFVRYGSERLSFRAERLKIKNVLAGPGARAVADKLELTDLGADPFRHAVSLEHAFGDGWRARLEWVRDVTTSDRRDIGVASIVWTDTLVRVPSRSSRGD